MKHLILYIRYICLLIFSGLILPFYNSTTARINNTEHYIQAKVRISNSNNKPGEAHFSIFNDVVANLFPALKNLN